MDRIGVSTRFITVMKRLILPLKILNKSNRMVEEQPRIGAKSFSCTRDGRDSENHSRERTRELFSAPSPNSPRTLNPTSLMDLTDDSSRHFLLSSFLFSSSPARSVVFESLLRPSPGSPIEPPPPPRSSNGGDSFLKESTSEKGKIELYSPLYYAACTVGGIASCGLTHTGVTPLDLVKCNMQIDPTKYKSILSGFGVLLKEQGLKGFFRGWVPTLLGYSAQGAFKFGFYEFFKKLYSDIAGQEYSSKYKTLIYLAGSASAEVIADVALCPMEAIKVRVQTQPGFARGLSDGFPRIINSEGALGLYKGLVPLWGRQIPFHVVPMEMVEQGLSAVLHDDDTMMKFACFETIVDALYKYVLPTRKDKCSKPLQLAVSFAGGYVAGVFCAVVSHPADNLVSFLNNSKGATVSDAVMKLGLWGLFSRGLTLRILMIGTLTGAQWGIYDAFKVLVGLPTTGGVASGAATASGRNKAD
ncbi:mitochondrial phosphate carrier protein 3, mitochondrial-like isoform X3 [Asparagus officinalis]|uniref:mitochondrial phosphate carrier protein 3, mitochondrial-like isoform X3 n=1 Tax=Asparagus officinalis TaxID=4686 RepID=UPI00098DF8B5|nr:mitochondrial phosphate carrier protein 3, mitochondrial-like isoform X3 [Asparagus officinalis]